MSRSWLTRGLLAAGAAVVLYWAWGWVFTSDEARVRAAVDALAATLSTAADDPLGQVAALGTLRRQLAEDVVVATGGGAEVLGRDAVAGLWQRLRTSAGITRVRTFDVEVVVTPDGRTAEASGVVEITRMTGGAPERELREVRATFTAAGRGVAAVAGGSRRRGGAAAMKGGRVSTTIDLQFQGRPGVIATAVIPVGGGVVLVDPGPTSCLPALEAGLAALHHRLADVRALLLTHIHLDHAGAAGTIVARVPGLPVYVHDIGARHLASPEKLLASATRLYGAAMDSLWGEFRAVPAASLRSLAGGETLDLDGRRFDVAYTPGHAVHHVSYLDRTDGTAYVGDTAGIRVRPGYVLPATPPPDIDSRALGREPPAHRGLAPVAPLPDAFRRGRAAGGPPGDVSRGTGPCRR